MPVAVRKAKFADIEENERKKPGAQAGARHVSWESCQLAAHTRVGRSVGRIDRPPQWGVVHEHTPVSIPVFMNTKIRIRIFTDRPGQEETDHAHLSNARQLPSTGRSVIPRYSAATKKKSPICAKNYHFPCVHEQNADFCFSHWPVASARPDQNPKEMASQSGPGGPLANGRTVEGAWGQSRVRVPSWGRRGRPRRAGVRFLCFLPRGRLDYA